MEQEGRRAGGQKARAGGQGAGAGGRRAKRKIRRPREGERLDGEGPCLVLLREGVRSFPEKEEVAPLAGSGMKERLAALTDRETRIWSEMGNRVIWEATRCGHRPGRRGKGGRACKTRIRHLAAWVSPAWGGPTPAREPPPPRLTGSTGVWPHPPPITWGWGGVLGAPKLQT